MDKPIKVGDLVMVVKATPCCGIYQTTHPVFRVSGFEKDYFHCRFCGQGRKVLAANVADTFWLCDVDRLKRIPPLSELEGERRDEEITA